VDTKYIYLLLSKKPNSDRLVLIYQLDLSVGQIISMQAVFGSLVRLRTRELYTCIVLRASWKSLVALTAPAIEELRFWINSVNQLNEKGNDLHESDLCALEALRTFHCSAYCF
jgi:hypothetical protein